MEQFLWVEKYRPRTIRDCILPEHLKQVFQRFVDDRFVPNLLLTGGPGVGKTTVARAMLEEIGLEYLILNGSLNVGKDTLRTDIQMYASSVSMTGERKYVILDEADYLSAIHVQPALRNFIEEFSANCGFILTCNYRNKIIPPLHSRCSVVEFQIQAKEKPDLAAQFLARTCSILENENVQFDKKVVAQIILTHFPDWRRVLNELQRYSAVGRIDTGLLASAFDTTGITELVAALRKKNFTQMRKWIAENASLDTVLLFRKLYEGCSDFMKPDSIPQLVLILADYQYKSAFVADQEINLVACMTQIMVDCEFTN